jgi:hypothetical protein
MHMRFTSWYATLGIIGASAIAVVACTSNTTVNNNGGTDDGGVTSDDSGSTGDTGTTTPTPDGGGTVTPEAGGDGGVVCDTSGTTDACELCSLQSCCAEENQCQNGEPVDDAGMTECQGIFTCVQDLIAPPADSGVDAGTTFSDAATTCSMGHMANATADFNALSTCLTSKCSTQCQ